MPLPSQLKFSPLNSQQRAWLQGQPQAEGTPTPIPLITGDAKGFVVFYNSTTSISISGGRIEANGEFYALSSDDTHALTTLANPFDFHYIYIDDSASSAPNAVIIDDTAEPTFDNIRRGWYNGDDRLIGVVESDDGTATIAYFSVNNVDTSRKYIRNTVGKKSTLALNQNPDNAWQAPNVSASSAFLPVNAVSIKVLISGADIGGGASVLTGVSNAEMAAVNTVFETGTFLQVRFQRASDVTEFMPLGVSRDIRIAGAGNDDNVLSAFVFGYGYSR